VKHLVVDANAFIKNVPLQDLAENIYTVRQVVDEIRDRQTRARLAVLPYDLQILEPTEESIATVTKFSKATGDYAAMSRPDLLLVSLTHTLHLRHSQVSLREEPLSAGKEVTFEKDKTQSDKNMLGFVAKGKDEEDDEEEDEEGWITSSNYKESLECQDATVVGCYTSDFAMQNTLLSIGLEIIAPSGQRVTTIRTWILRCYGCFNLTNKLDKQFCPRCGNKTLKRVSVTVDENGCKKIHLNPRVNISAKGKRFPLPKPKGGKHVEQPILVEDQRICMDKPTKSARQVNDVFRDDLVEGTSPFLQKDVYSRSAMLHQGTKYWNRRNPNVSHK
jgi:RNA-binding protein NOB1